MFAWPIRRWVRGTHGPAADGVSARGASRADAAKGGVLFIPYKAGQIAALRSTISAWMRLAIFEAMSQPEGDQRLWFVVDELDALGQIDGLKDALARNPDNADYHNLFAFSVRKGPNPVMAVVFEHYNEALRLDPKHRGAHEYMGEAYLAVNDLPKAREQLAALDKLCFFGCEEYSDLKKAVADYEASHKP